MPDEIVYVTGIDYHNHVKKLDELIKKKIEESKNNPGRSFQRWADKRGDNGIEKVTSEFRVGIDGEKVLSKLMKRWYGVEPEVDYSLHIKSSYEPDFKGTDFYPPHDSKTVHLAEEKCPWDWQGKVPERTYTTRADINNKMERMIFVVFVEVYDSGKFLYGKNIFKEIWGNVMDNGLLPTLKQPDHPTERGVYIYKGKLLTRFLNHEQR